MASIFPSISSFHPTEINLSGTQCMGRRTNDDLRDRRFTPFVYRAIQCANAAIVDSAGLCKTCVGHADAYFSHLPGGLEWHGRVSESIRLMPETSHIAGSPWYNKRLLEGTLLFGEERSKTACQEGRLKVAQRVPEAELRRFARSRCDLNIESLYQSRQLWKKDLCFILKMLGEDIDVDKFNGDKLCRMIRLAMEPPALESVDAMEVTETQKKSKEVKTVDWSLAPGGEPVSWAHLSGHTLYGTHDGKGAITGDDGVKHKTPSGFAVHEFKKLQAAGIIRPDMVASVNGWYAVRIRLDDWVRFTGLRT